MFIRSSLILSAVAGALVLAGCSDQSADPQSVAPPADPVQTAEVIYQNANIYAVDPDNSWYPAMAVGEGRIVALGSEEEMAALAGDDTRVVDLGGRMVMPGIHDTHIHPGDAGISATLECSFRGTSLEAALSVLRGCIAAAEPGAWVRGGQWNEVYFLGHPQSPKVILDEIAPDNPVFLMDWSVHHAWVNSRALELLEIDDTTPDPKGGIVQRHPRSGETTGLLFDNAAYEQRKKLPRYSDEQNAQAMQWALKEISQYGITTIKDAIVTSDTMAAYQYLDKRSALPLRVKTALTWKSAWAFSHQDEIDLMANRAALTSERIDPNFAKIMLDGVPMTYTSALLEPYEPNDVVGPDHTGELMIPADQLTADVIELDRQGLNIKIHATGDAAARAALDAFEAAREANGDRGLLHEVSHAEMIHPDDVPRFKALGVAAEMCPILWYPIPGLAWETWFGRDRVPAWQVRTMHEAGALVTYGSDWPVVPTANPWPGIESMVTRQDPYSDAAQTLYPSESVDLATAVRIFTHNSAIANQVGDSSGSLEVGKDADFIVLSQNIFEVPITSVGDTQVVMSVVAGEAVFGEDQLP
ncbi:MAG: amidohydrolase [Pseudomonadota bacterium]